MEAPASQGFTAIAVGINADSLATWFLEAIHPLLIKERVHSVRRLAAITFMIPNSGYF